jgi:hypothetical protein
MAETVTAGLPTAPPASSGFSPVTRAMRRKPVESAPMHLSRSEEHAALGFERLTAASAVMLWIMGSASAVVVTAPTVRTHSEGRSQTGRREADHLYRLVGKVRLLFFWVSADDVGGTRITRRGGGAKQSIALLIGSEPSRAPRGVNEWGYVREDRVGDSTTVFGIRTVTAGESPDEAEARRTAAGNMAEFGLLCSTVSPLEVLSRTTAVYVGRDATYRDVDRVLDVVERSARWNGLHTLRPADTEAGFLTALDAMMRSTAIAAQSGMTPRGSRLAYVYKDAVYDLIQRRIERVQVLQTKSGSFRDLVRSEVVVKNRSTGSSTEFLITVGTGGALLGIPVAAVYQPNWWFKVELELDDDQDVPPDPSDDASMSRRIARLCSQDNE